MLNFNHLLELNELARDDAKRYPKKRELYNVLISDKGKHITGIVGPRGVGKTIILKQRATSNLCRRRHRRICDPGDAWGVFFKGGDTGKPKKTGPARCVNHTASPNNNTII